MAESPGSVDDLVAFDPQWCLFWAGNVTGFHLDIWLPYLRRSGYRYAILSGTDSFSAHVRTAVEPVPNVIVLEPFEAVRSWLKGSPNFRGFLYMGTKQENFKLVNGFGGRLHVWLGHGESDKVYNAFRTASLYDSLLVARYDVVKRYPRAIRRWVSGGALAIGASILEGALRDPWERPRPIRNVLYAPTWEGHAASADYSSVPEAGQALLDALPALRERGVDVVMRPHPTTGHRLGERKELLAALEAAGVRRGTNKAGDFAAADVMISDISGVTAEFLFTEKPTIMPVFDRLTVLGKDEARLASEYPWVYRWRVEREPLADVLARLEQADRLRAARAKSAKEMFRGHRSLEEAAVSFDLALDAVRWRKTRIAPRRVYEAQRRFRFLARRTKTRAAPATA